MMFTTKLIAVFAALSTTALAADVYSAFFDKDGNSLSDTHFDVSNGGCFVITPATQISFSQANAVANAQGPYCLSGFKDSSCSTLQGRQQFQNVVTNTGTADPSPKYNIGAAADAASFMWSAAGCP